MRKGFEIPCCIPHQQTRTHFFLNVLALPAKKTRSSMNFRYLSAGWLAGIRQGLMGQQWVADCSKSLPLRTTSLSKDAKYL